MGIIRFVDAVDLKPSEVTQEVRDYYANNNQGPVQPLKIRIAATHAGKVTRNNGFYLPHKMRDGAGSFTKQYNKPIQVHHEEKRDPIGRVIASNYIDTSTSLRDSFDGKNWKDSTRTMTRVFDGFIKGTLSHRELVDVANQYFIQDNSRLDDPDYEGLGYVEVVALISDADAIQKVLDGRYLTGSVGASTNQAICSVCKQDWAGDDGQCEHRPGKVYDDARCVLIAGDLNYEEYSFVNKPADRHSRVIEVNHNGVKDFVQVGPDSEPAIKDSIPEISLIVDRAKHVKEEHTMSVKDETQAPAPETTAQDATPVATPEVETPVIVEEPVTQIKDELEILKDFYGESFDEVAGSDDPWGLDYAKMMYGLVADASDEDKEAITKEVKDAVLKAADRKKLGEKTFCGPDRSYPVPDCTHARAAVRLASHASNPSSIVACAKRKAARLGCPMGEDKADKKDSLEVTSPGKFETEYFDRYSDKKLLKMKLGLEAALKERALSPCKECEEKDSARIAELESLLDEVRQSKSTDILDLEHLNRAVADAAAEVRTTHIRHITDLRMLKGDKVSIDDVTSELKEKNGSEIRLMLRDLTEKVDMQKIADNLNSGLANKPDATVTVDDPTQSIKDAVKGDPLKETSTKAVDEKLSKVIRLQYFNIKLTQGQEVADKYIDDCKTQGVVPSDWSIRG